MNAPKPSLQKSPSQPIGVFDSGVGGLTVLNRLKKKFPGEDFIYLADTANMPYGIQPFEALYAPIHASLNWLFKTQNAKFVVIACNTARAALTQWEELEYIAKPHEKHALIGPIAPVCRWIGQSDLRRVGVLATVSTVASNIYPNTMACFNEEVLLFQHASKDLAQRIETGAEFLDSASLETLKQEIAPLLAHRIEALILGCTHYPHIEESFRKILPPGIALLNPANHMPDVLWTDLDVQEQLNPRLSGGTVSYFVTGNPESFQATATHLPLKFIEITEVTQAVI